MPVDVSGLFVYIKDLSTGKVWNPTVIPCKEKLDFWRSFHGIGYTRFEAEKDGLKVSVKCFIGKENVLVYDLDVSSDRAREVQVFACQEMALMEYLRECQWHHTSKNSINILYHEKEDALVYEYFIDQQHRPDETPFVYFTANKKCESFCGSRDVFIGSYRGLADPIAIEKGNCGNKELKGGEGMFSMSFHLSLKKDQTENLSVFLGTLERTESLSDVVAKVHEKSYAKTAFAWLKDYWENRLSRFRVEIPDKDAQRMINTWNPWQAYINMLVCREISFYATGCVRGVGVRDASQDILANVMYDFGAAKERLKLILHEQFQCGKTTHYFYPVEKSPSLISDRSDNHLWMIYTAYFMAMEQGDLAFLNEIVPYYDGGEGTVFEHLEKSIDFSLHSLGEHGIPLMLGSDWNDMLTNVCTKGKGESVMVSEMLILACRYMKELCALIGKDPTRYEKIIDEQTKILNDFCWDGKWFIRAVSDEGLKIGAEKERCAKIFPNSQSWAVMAEATTEERAKSCMQAVMDHLDCGFGILSLDPPLERNYPSKENELTFAQPGMAENGGVFCHASTWNIIAHCMLGNNEDAYKIYSDMIPNRIIDRFGVDVYTTEPYIYSSSIRGPKSLVCGQAGISWLSGTANWMLIAVEQYIFGIKPRWNGLEIRPCIPNAWKDAKAVRNFRGFVVEVHIHNENGRGNRVSKTLVDGVEFSGAVIPVHHDLKIDVFMG